MIANSPSSVTESASSTIDPDAQASRANDGELSAGFQSDLTIDEDAVDGLLTAKELAFEFDENLNDGKLYAEYRRLAAEQAALRRVAALVARGVEPSEVFDAVTNEMRSCLHAAAAGLWRYETTGEIALLSVAAYLPDAAMKWPVGTRTPIEGNTLAAVVQRSGRPARMDTLDNATGTLAELVRAIGLRAAVGVPVIIDGRLWGLAAVGSDRPGAMPADTEDHMSHCAELIATALVAGYRDEQKRQLLAGGSQRSSLVDALLEGQAFDDWRMREVAGHLRLPIDGPFVVIAAHIPTAGDEPLPEIEAKLLPVEIVTLGR
jgi:GAF domain-containing protein